MRIAVLSDIHGNAIALEAVETHARARGCDLFFDLGDTVSGPLRPLETFDRIAALKPVSISGNHERQLLTLADSDLNASDAYALKCLGRERVASFKEKPASRRIEDVLLLHGSPRSDLEYFLEDIVDGRPVARRKDEVAALAADVDPDVTLMLCGHTHIQRATQLDNGQLIVNPGSVGLPAWADRNPANFHRMDAGSIHARYAIINKREGRWSVEFHLVDYDWKAAAQDAESLGRSDWATAIKTGYAAA